MKRFLLLLVILTLLPPGRVLAQGSDPWSEVFLEDGSLSPGLVDLGETTDYPDWMAVDLPFGQALNLPANYHRFQTPGGNIVVLPSASTLFFMAMNPQASGLNGAYGAVGTGNSTLIRFLGQVVGNNLDWNKIQTEHPEYSTPDQFWSAVLSGEQNAWTYFSGWGFISTLLQMSWDDAALRTLFLLYLNGSQDCAAIPGGCSGIVHPPETPRECPEPTVTLQQPVLVIQKSAPSHPLVVGQDTENRRGADLQVSVTIPAVIFTWYEPMYEEEDVCRVAADGETPDCHTGSGTYLPDGIWDTETVFKGCQQHVEYLPDAVASIQASAALDAASQTWITDTLGQSHYEAFIHQERFTLFPQYGTWSGNCTADGTCSASGQALRVPFADPGTFNLRLDVLTTGTQFRGVPITQPRRVSGNGTMQVYITLPALVP